MSNGLSPKFPLYFSPEGGYALNKSIIEVVKQNFKNLLLTVPGERIFDINFGVGLKRYLFEPRTDEVYQAIRDRIYSQVDRYMPFLQIQEVTINHDQNQENTIYITVKYYILNISKEDIINLTVR